jgi:hypothetical protein
MLASRSYPYTPGASPLRATKNRTLEKAYVLPRCLPPGDCVIHRSGIPTSNRLGRGPGPSGVSVPIADGQLVAKRS